MTIRHMKIFVAVCDSGSITRTAEAMHISQPAVSHTISELEKYYNITLFERINQRLVLTELGKEILGKAREIVNLFDEFEEFASHGSESPKVKIGCSLTLGQTVIPKFLEKMKSLYPKIEPKIFIKPSNVLETELENGNIDFALIEGELSSQYLRSEPFLSDRIIAVAHTDFEIPDSLTLNELQHYPLLLRERGSSSREYAETTLKQYKITPEPFIESANNQAIVAALYSNLGIALLPESFVKGHIERGKFKEINIAEFDGITSNYIYMHKNKKLNTVCNCAYEALKGL